MLKKAFDWFNPASMSAVHKKRFSSFVSLNLTQFFSATNDNLYKLLLVFLLITIKGEEHSNTILSLAGAIFVIPFIIFASLTGTLADRYSKRTLIYITRLLEVISMILGLLAFAYKSVAGGYFVLFLLATHSALFSPCKFGVLPEIVKKEELSHYNGIMTATTYLAIILGTFMAALLTDITKNNFVLSILVCIAISLMAALSSLGIQKTKPQAAQKKVSARFISETYATLKRAKKTRYLLSAIIFSAYFLFMGAYTQLNIIPYALQSLHLAAVDGGYLFLLTALGIGFGSFLAGQLSHKQVELAFVPLATIGISFCFLGLFLFSHYLIIAIFFLFLLGLFGGFYIVPIETFIQEVSPKENRGQNVAAANFMSFLGVICASGLLALLGNSLKLHAKSGFLVVGILTFCLSILLSILLLDQLLRLIVSITSKFWQLKIKGLTPASIKKPTLLIGSRRSWLDTLLVMATLPRLIRYIVPIRRKIRGRSFLYRLLSLIPFDSSSLFPIQELTLDAIIKELSSGQSVCLMQPITPHPPSSKEWKELLHQTLPGQEIPVIFIHIEREAHPALENNFKAIKNLFSSPIIINYGTAKK